MSYVAPRLSNHILPVTKGTDRVFTIRRRDADNAPMDWNCNVYMDIDIDRTNPTRIVAQVVGDLATIRIEAETANQCRTGMTWRAVMSQAGSPSLETALLVGTFERNDGK